MLDPASSLKDAIKNLKPTTDKEAGIKALVKVIGEYMNKVQGGPLGTPGIFKLNEPIMVQLMMQMMPVADASWVVLFMTAFQLGCTTATITPGTVINPVWLGSTKDILTPPIGGAAIPTIAASAALVQAKLATSKASKDSPQDMADAISTATKAFIFLCIGLGAPPVLPPIPVPTPAA